MSYEHPILVPGATGHDDVEALRGVIEDLASRSALLEYLPTPVQEMREQVAGIKEQLEEPELDTNEIQELVDTLAEGIEDLMDLLP